VLFLNYEDEMQDRQVDVRGADGAETKPLFVERMIHDPSLLVRLIGFVKSLGIVM
jgi:hypothetical protein